MKKKNLFFALFMILLGFGFVLNVNADDELPKIVDVKNTLSTQVRVEYELNSCSYAKCGVVLLNENWAYKNNEAMILRSGSGYKVYDGLNKGENYTFRVALYWFDENGGYHNSKWSDPKSIVVGSNVGKVATDLVILNSPNKTNYVVGEKFDPTGMKVRILYNDGSITELDDFSGCTFKPSVIEKDTTKVRVTCDGIYSNQRITVSENKLIEEITEITSKPNKVIYEDEEYFDPAGMKIKVKYSDNSTEEVEVTKDICKFIPDKLTVETDKVTIECGNTLTNVDVTVKEKEKTLENISIKTEATKKEYIEGEKFNSDGMVITYKYDDGTTVDANVSEEVSNNKCTIDPNGELSKNDTKVTVTCSGKSVDQNITVTSKELEKIEVVSPPNKVNYMEGENFDPTGLKIKATYSNGSSDEILDGKGCEFTPSDSLKTDDKSVTVTCNSKSTTLDIVVNAKSVEVNAPVLSDNMIPVYYDIENNMWRKANINNEKTTITYILGDVNGNGKVNASDVAQIRRYISESSSVLYDNPWALNVADVNRDGRINDEDLSLVASLSKDHPIGEEQTEVIDTTWYDYGKKKWANAASVSDTNRNRYLSAEVGQEIKMNDILTMQVWIPRYKYKVWNYNSDGNKTSTPKEVEIVSEKVISKIEKKESPSKTVYVVEEKFDATGMILNVTYNDNSSKEIVVSDEIANGKCSIDPSGELTTDVTSVKVTCGGFDVTQDITVKQEAVVNVVVQNGTVSTPSKKVDYNTDAVFDIVPMNDSYVYGYVSCTNDQIASYNDKVLTVSNLNSDTTCTLKLTNEITSLYEDGTLIINEQGLDKASNLEKHGKVINSYDAMNDDNSYSFGATSQVWKGERDLIKSVEIGKTLKPTVTSYWFYDLRNLEKVNLTNLDISKVTDMYGMFKYAGYNVSNFSLNLTSLDISSVETMKDMFMYAGYNADVFNLNLSSWNLSNLGSMDRIFMYAGYNATTWNVGDLSKWNTSNVTSMGSAFKYAGVNATIWNIGDLSGWDTTKVDYMGNMFEGAGMNVGTFKDIGNLKISSGCYVGNFAGNSPKFRGNVTIYGSLTGDDSMFKYSDYSSTQYYGVTDSSSYANIYYANDDAKAVVESILSNKKSNQNIYNKGLRTE